LLVTVNNGLKFEIEIVHDLSCHPINLHLHYITSHDVTQSQVCCGDTHINNSA